MYQNRVAIRTYTFYSGAYQGLLPAARLVIPLSIEKLAGQESGCRGFFLV